LLFFFNLRNKKKYFFPRIYYVKIAIIFCKYFALDIEQIQIDVLLEILIGNHNIFFWIARAKATKNGNW
jgi:hypothetical protein